MTTTNDLPEPARKQLQRLLGYLQPSQNDPAFLVLKAHLLAEEILNVFLESHAARAAPISSARLTFSQLVLLCTAFHPCVSEDWWVWSALKKLNFLRNKLAHNLEPLDIRERMTEFSVYIVESAGITKNPDRGSEYVRLAESGGDPFLLALVALLAYLSGALQSSNGCSTPTES